MNEQLKVIISAEIDKLKKNIKEGTRLIDKFGDDGAKALQEFNDEMQKVGGGAKKALGVMAGAITGAVTAVLALGASTADYRKAQAQLNTAFEAAGASAAEAKSTYSDLYRTLGDTDKAVEASLHLAKLTTNEKDLAEWTNICKGIYGTFGDTLPIEALTEAANETAKTGQVTGTLADALNWASISSDQLKAAFGDNKKAIKAYNKAIKDGENQEDAFNAALAKCNTEAEREAAIRTLLNGMYSDAAALYEENNAAALAQNAANEKMSASMAKIGEAVAPINAALTELGADVLAQLEPYITEFAEKYLPQITAALSEVGTAIGEVLTWLFENWELVSTIATIIAAICVALTVFSTVMGIVNAVMMASPVTWIVLAIVAAIAALVTIIVLVIKYWDEIKAATLACWNAIVDAVKIAIDWVVGLFEKIIAWVKENWQGLLLLLLNPFAGAFKLVYDNCEGFRNKVDEFIAKIKELVQKGFNTVKEKIINPIKDAFNNVKQKFTDIVTTIKEKLNTAKEFVSGIVEKIKGFFKFNIELPKIKLPHFSVQPKGWEIGDLLKGSIPKLGIEWYAKGGVFDKPTLFGYGNGALGGLGENGAEAVVPLENNLEWLDKLAGMLGARMGNTPVVLNVDGKVFAQTAISTINAQTKQTGKLQLNLV